MEKGYCSDVLYMKKLPENCQQREGLEGALNMHGYEVGVLTDISGGTGSQYHSSSDILFKANTMQLQTNSGAKFIYKRVHMQTS